MRRPVPPRFPRKENAISSSTVKKLGIVAAVAALFVLFYSQGWHQELSFENLKARQGELRAYTEENTLTMVFGFGLVYIVMAAAQLPGAALLTLAAGAIFGFWLGTLVVSFASTIGATVAMLLSRYLFRESIEKRYGKQLKSFNEGVQREGAFYLFSLRLLPVVPFWLINLGFGLTKMRAWTFYWVSQIGMLAGTAVYVNAGTQLGQLESIAGILSFEIIGALVLLAIFPFLARNLINAIARKVAGYFKARRVYKGWKKPEAFDYNVVVIGAGSAGLVASLIAAAVKARVALVEKNKMGGDCLNTGCVPSKALIRSAKMVRYFERAPEWGLGEVDVEVDFPAVMDRVHGVIKRIEPHDSRERYTGLGVECIAGTAKIVSPWEVHVDDGCVLKTKNIVIASGAEPLVPPIPGLDRVDALTSDNLWELRELPKRLVVLGGGPIGSEMTQAFARLGSQVTQVEMDSRILTREDPEISEMVKARFEEEGIRVLTGHKATGFEAGNGEYTIVCEKSDGETVRIPFDKVLVALGRKARVKGFGLEELGIETVRPGTIERDEFLRTKYPNVYVCGDVAGPYQFTHTASHQAWYATVNALFSPLKDFKVDNSVIPWATFTDPEVARVGLNELEAEEQETEYEVSTYDLDDLDRAITDGEAHGVVKVLTVPGKDKILGVTIVGHHAGDLLAEYVLAMKHKIGLNKILGTIHTYPTLAEANKYAAGVWKKAHKPEKVLAILEKFHAWRRGEPLPGKVKAALAALLLLLAVGLGSVVACATRGSSEVPRPEAATELGGEYTTAAYARALERFVDDDGWVDYAGLKAAPGELERYYASLAAIDPADYETWRDDEKIALWNNAYNALTLLAIVNNYPIERSSLSSVAFPRGIRWISGVWEDLTFTVMGREMTLNEIEHEVLRKEFDEPRIHMALVCAAVSCPPLRAEPFDGERLDAQLDDQTRRFLARPSNFRIDRDAGKVHLSKIFDWFGEDFKKHLPESGFEGQSDKVRGVLGFVAGYLDDADRDYLASGDYEVAYLDYDWSLNEQGTAGTEVSE